MPAQTRRAWDWLSAILFILLMASVSMRLSITRWVTGLDQVQLITLVGAILGLALGISSFRSTGMRWLIGGYSLFLLPWQLGNMIQAEGDGLQWFATLGTRLGFSLGNLFSGQPVQDPVLFLAWMSFLFWGIAIFSGIQVTRHPGKLPILLPASIPLLIIQYYDGAEPQRLWISAFFFFCALLLLGRLNFIDLEASLRDQRVSVDMDAHLDVGYATFIATTVLVLVAWFAPLPGAAIPAAVLWWNDVTDRFRETRDNLGDALAAIQGHGRQGNTRFGNVLGLGTQAALGEEILFIATPQSQGLARHYWRARVYDTYEDGYWTSRQAREIEILPGQPDTSIPDVGQRNPTEVNIEWQGSPQSLLVGLPQPVNANRAGTLSYTPTLGGPLDVMALIASEPVQPGDRYTTNALTINPTISALRNSGVNYPAWVRARYLQLPEGFSPRVAALAEEITAGQSNPYDKAVAITAYLRREMDYAETIPAPPPGTDSLEWFLFTTRQGYCNYYATAQVMMLRAVGVPARMAVGYAQGQLDSTGGYTVRNRDSHAWPEVYFEGIGWVEFEPTGNQPELIRPSFLGGITLPAGNPEANPAFEEELTLPEPTPIPDEISPEGENWWRNISLQAILVWFIIALLILLLARALWQANQAQPFTKRIPRLVHNAYKRVGLNTPAWLVRWLAWSELGAVEKSFQAINQALHWMGESLPVHATPAERAQHLIKLVPQAGEHINTLHGELEKSLFTTHPASSSLAFRAGWAIRYHTVRRMLSRWVNGV